MTADKIVGAAALAAAVFLESTAPEIEEQLDGCKLHAPSLLRFEMANVCVRKIRKYPHERDRILAQHDAFLTIAIAEHEADHARVVAVAERFNLSAYDAAYLWLAQSLGFELVTLDDRLRKAAAKA